MCGIIGYKGDRDSGEIVVEALKKLEYRGYDSWGIQSPTKGSKSKLMNSDKYSHTRWAKSKGINISSSSLKFPEKEGVQMNIIEFTNKEKCYVRINKSYRNKISNELRNKNQLIGKINIPRRTLNRMRYVPDHWCNLKTLLDLSIALKIDSNDLLKNITKIKTKNSFPVNLNEFELDCRLARILGHIIGDGGIHINKKENKYRVFYVNNETKLLDSFKADVYKTFKGIKIYFREREKHGNELWLPSTVGAIFYKLLRYDTSNDVKKIPQIIKDSNDEKIIGSFLQALYDDEGYIYPNKKMVLIAQVNKRLLAEIRKLFTKIEVKPNRILEHKGKNRSLMYYFSITGKDNISKFNEKINFIHPVKRKKLRLLLEVYKR